MAGVAGSVRARLLAAARGRVLAPGTVRRVPLGLAAGLRFPAAPGETLHLYLGTVEAELARHVRRLARPGVRCFDVGGCNAYYALVLARLTGTEVVSFEADPGAAERMERTLALNPAQAGRVRIVRAYVADETRPGEGIVTLDDLVAQHGLGPPGLVKIDVEGAEGAVLTGARGLLERARPALIIETHGPEVEADCARALAELGYRVRVVGQRRRLREGRSRAHNRWLVAEARRA